MNIIFEEKLTEDIREKYILLELDTFSPEPNVFKKCWALIGKDEVNVQEVHNMDQFTDLHHNMIKNYGLKNWKFCHDALDHLIGKFRGEIERYNIELICRTMGINAKKRNSFFSHYFL